MIVETQDRDKARADHAAMIEDMQKLVSNPGWQRVRMYLDAEASAAFNCMKQATNGDLMMKASQAYVTLCSIRDLPINETHASSARLVQMDEEDKAERKYKASLTTKNTRP